MVNIVQWGLNLALMGGLIYLWVMHRRKPVQGGYDQITLLVQQLESRLQQLESELNNFRGTFQEKLKEVEAVVEQANRVLKTVRSQGAQFPLTQEESELKEAMYFSPEKEEIPSVAYLENTKIRLQRESSVDLKTLLKGQLS